MLETITYPPKHCRTLFKEKAAVLKLETEDTGENHDKINKTVLEVLAKVGALESFGITRKDVVDNVLLFLDYSKIDTIELKNEEYSLKQKALFEIENIEMILTDCYSDEEKAELDKYDISGEFPVGLVTNIVDKMTKKQKPYKFYTILTYDGRTVNIGDFNGKLKSVDISDKVILQTTLSESGFTNLLRYIKFKTDVFGTIWPEKNSTSKDNVIVEHNVTDANMIKSIKANPNSVINVTILDDIENLNLVGVKTINVYDLDKSLLSIITK